MTSRMLTKLHTGEAFGPRNVQGVAMNCLKKYLFGLKARSLEVTRRGASLGADLALRGGLCRSPKPLNP